MNWISLIAAVGFGAIATKLLDVLWLQRVVQRSERDKWLREQRLRVYSSLTKELISEGLWRDHIDERDAWMLSAESMLLTNDTRLINLIDEYVPDVLDTKRRLDQFINNGTSTIEERTEMRSKEEMRLREKARLIVKELRTSLVKD